MRYGLQNKIYTILGVSLTLFVLSDPVRYLRIATTANILANDGTNNTARSTPHRNTRVGVENQPCSWTAGCRFWCLVRGARRGRGSVVVRLMSRGSLPVGVRGISLVDRLGMSFV